MAKVRLENEWKLWAGIGAICAIIAGYLYFVSRPPMEGDEYLWIVERVDKGTTLHTRGSGSTMDITIIGLDVPPKGVKAAQDFLERKLAKQWVRLKPVRDGDGGRKVGYVYLSGADITASMIRQGLALVDRNEKGIDVRPYLELEQEAKKARRGLWSQSGSGGK